MASVVQDEYRKDTVLFEKIVMKYHPDFMYRDNLEKDLAINDAINGRYNVEFLIEETIALCGGLKRSSEKGMDYTDKTDCKTCSVQHRDVMRSNSMRWVITSTGAKQSWLRTVVYNPFLASVAFFMIPLHSRLKNYNVQVNGRGRIDGVYRLGPDLYEGIEKYRYQDFTGICKNIEVYEEKYMSEELNCDPRDYDNSCIEDFLA